MNEFKPTYFTQNVKLSYDWIDKNSYLIHFKMLKVHAKQGIIVDKFHEIMSLKQNKWLEIYISSNTKEGNEAINDFEKDFHRVLNYAFGGKTMENVRMILKGKIIEKDEAKKII